MKRIQMTLVLAITLCVAPAVAQTTQPAAPAAKAAPATKAPAKVAPAPVAKAPAATPVAKVAPAAAPAKSEKTQTWWQALLVPVLSVFGLFLAGFLVGGLRKLVQLIEKKWNFDIPDQIESFMYEKARWGVAWAEELAEKRLLYADGKKTPSAEKLTQVVDMLMKTAEEKGYGKEWGREKIEALVEGVLHLERGISVGTDADMEKRTEKVEAAKVKANGDSAEKAEG